MPGQRLSHPEQSTSRKVSELDDFQYRVWEQTKLSSDDFGVMPLAATVLRADNVRLRKRATERQVQDALQHLVDVGLLLAFEHQGEAYVCAPVWQTWQKIAFPRKTARPKPPADVLARCDAETQSLFELHPGGKKRKKTPEPFQNDSGTAPDTARESSGRDSRTSARGGPANANADANAHAPERGPGRTAGTLVTPPATWWHEHGTHVRELCDWGMCLPEKLAAEFTNRLIATRSLPEGAAREEVLVWARGVRARYVAIQRVPTGKAWTFWPNEWDATYGATAAGAAVDPLAGLREVARRG